MSNGFHSFIDHGGFVPRQASDSKILNLLEGEIVSSQYDDASFYTQFGENYYGSVYCTNIRLCFAPVISVERVLLRRFRLFDDQFDVPLVMIHKVYFSVADTTDGESTTDQTPVSKRKFKELTSSVSSMEMVSSLRIILKDLRVVVLDLSKSQNSANLANHVFHFSRPSSVFSIAQCGKVNGVTSRAMFTNSMDWSRELKRCNAEKFWRVADFMKEPLQRFVNSFPNAIVVPNDIVKHDLDQMVPQFRHGRFPIWVWSHFKGSALLRSSFPEDTPNADQLMGKICRSVAQITPKKDTPYILRLKENYTADFVRNAFDSLRRLVALDSYDLIKKVEEEWFSLLDDTRWPRLVMYCLKSTADIVATMHDQEKSTIIQELDGYDLSAVISALVQLCLEKDFRQNTDRFVALIYKEFSALGHPFTQRTFNSQGTSPVFLLFIDAVHHLLEMFPSQFAFSHHFLIALWDASTLGFVPALSCNNADEIIQLVKDCPTSPAPPFDFLTVIFTTEYRSTFKNVWHDAAMLLNEDGPIQELVFDEPIRPPIAEVEYIFWNELYQRWLPPANVTNGGKDADEERLNELMDALYNSSPYAPKRWEQKSKFFAHDDMASSAWPYSLSESSIPDSSWSAARKNKEDTLSVSFSMLRLNSKEIPNDTARSVRPSLAEQISRKLPRRSLYKKSDDFKYTE